MWPPDGCLEAIVALRLKKVPYTCFEGRIRERGPTYIGFPGVQTNQSQQNSCRYTEKTEGKKQTKVIEILLQWDSLSLFCISAWQHYLLCLLSNPKSLIACVGDGEEGVNIQEGYRMEKTFPPQPDIQNWGMMKRKIRVGVPKGGEEGGVTCTSKPSKL